MLPLSYYSSGARLPVSALMPLTAALLCLGISLLPRGVAPPRGGPVYSVGMLRALVQRDPDGWVGRTVRVRAIAARCTSWLVTLESPCIGQGAALIDARSAHTTLPLPLKACPPRSSTLTALLRRIPWIRALVARPQAVRWGAEAIYQVQVRAPSRTACNAPSGIAADLLDADPAAAPNE